MTRDDKWVRLAQKAAAGSLTQDEIDSILLRLQQDIDPYDKYPLIDALGELQDPRFVPDIEPFLTETRAPQVAGLALRVLCTGLKLSEHYVDRIAEFVDGLPWDEADDARLIAIQVAGEHLRHHHSAELLELLISIEDDPNERTIVRDAALDALGRGIGIEWKELRRTTKADIRTRAKERLG